MYSVFPAGGRHVSVSLVLKFLNIQFKKNQHVKFLTHTKHIRTENLNHIEGEVFSKKAQRWHCYCAFVTINKKAKR